MKTAASQRRITLSPGTVQAMRPLLAGKGPDDVVFTMRGGGVLHHGNFTARWLKPAVAACAQLGVDQRLRAHGFRHTHAAWLLSAGRPVTSVQKRLGHENALTTTKIYGHHIREVDEGDLEIVDGVIGGLVALDRDGEDVSAATRPELFVLCPADAGLPLLDDSDDDDLTDKTA